MRRLILVLLMAHLTVPVGRAGEPPGDKKHSGHATAADRQYEDLVQEFEEQNQPLSRAYDQAQTQAQRQKASQDKYILAVKYGQKFLKLAQAHPTSRAAVDALGWTVLHVPHGPIHDRSIALLLKRHIKSKQLGRLALDLAETPSASHEKALRRIISSNPHHDVKGMAMLALARVLKAQKRDKAAEKMLEAVVARYSDVETDQGTLGKVARRELFKARHLAIGTVAPNIVGEDADGLKFQLTDYRGKVVVLDFWGEW